MGVQGYMLFILKQFGEIYSYQKINNLQVDYYSRLYIILLYYYIDYIVDYYSLDINIYLGLKNIPLITFFSRCYLHLNHMLYFRKLLTGRRRGENCICGLLHKLDEVKARNESLDLVVCLKIQVHVQLTRSSCYLNNTTIFI